MDDMKAVISQLSLPDKLKEESTESNDIGLLGEIQMTNQMFEQKEQNPPEAGTVLRMSRDKVEDVLIGVNYDCLKQF